ncbi:MAG: hypothetical protein PF445_10285 [Melioribacteraceae bacterium]|nr:hypothetical protein [Melioribacteraceae bacterium]
MQNRAKPKLENIQRLEKLYKYLNYEVSSSVLYIGSWFIPIFIPLLILAAIVFTPFMLFVLYKENKKGWIIFFVVTTIIPIILLTFLYPILLMLGLIPFYFFCFILRMEAKGWITEMRARNDLVLHKIRKENEGQDLEDWMVMR